MFQKKSNERFSRNGVINKRTDVRDALSLQRLRRETKNGQTTDLNNPNVEFRGFLKSQKMAKNEFTHGNNELLCSRVSRYNFKNKVRTN